jgi:hypothetical protein
MAFSGMLRRVDLVRTDIWEEISASFISLSRLLITASVAPSSPILVTLMNEALTSSETLVLTRATRRNIPEDAILHPFHHFLLLFAATSSTNLAVIIQNTYTLNEKTNTSEHQTEIWLVISGRKCERQRSRHVLCFQLPAPGCVRPVRRYERRRKICCHN